MEKGKRKCTQKMCENVFILSLIPFAFSASFSPIFLIFIFTSFFLHSFIFHTQNFLLLLAGCLHAYTLSLGLLALSHLGASLSMRNRGDMTLMKIGARERQREKRTRRESLEKWMLLPIYRFEIFPPYFFFHVNFTTFRELYTISDGDIVQ